MYISGIQEDSVVDGEGIRLAIFISGCKHNCYNCHNTQTHEFTYGKKYDIDLRNKIFSKIEDFYDGITLTGGDPMYSPKEVLELVKEFKLKFPNKNIWLYTGFTWEEIIKDEDKFNLAKECDVIVDGKYIEDLKDYSLSFRGSTNQRFIDVPLTLKENLIVNYQFTF